MRHDNPVCKDRSPGAPASAGLEYPEIWEKKVVITALDLARTVLAVISVSQSARSQDRQFARSFRLALYPPRRTSLGAGLRLGGDR
jgi:hypothetical protein